MTKSSALNCYYGFLTVFTLVLVIHTVFIGSQHVGNGRLASKMERERVQLSQQKQQMERDLAARESLNARTLEASAEGYQFSNRVIRVDLDSQVALR